MSFNRLFPSGVSDGYNLPSHPLNMLDGYVANALDKTGDTLEGNLNCIDGSIVTFEGGSTLNFQTGSQLTFDSGSSILGTVSTLSLNVTSGSITTALGVPITLNGSASITTLTTGGVISLTSTSLDRSIALVPSYSSFFSVDGTGAILQSSVSSATCIVPCKLPHNSTITAIFSYMQGAGGHVGLPSTMPSVALKRVELSTGTVSTIATATDASASLATYEQNHQVTASSLSHTIDTSAYSYFFQLSGEASTNSLTGLYVYAIVVRLSVAEIALA